jgi:hypothetical protein
MTTTNRICRFCQQIAPYTPLEDMELHGIKVYYCFSCQAEYIYWRDGTIANTSLYTSINDKMYRWSVYPNDGMRLWYFRVPGIPGARANKGGKVLFHIENNYANITPQNVEAKIRNILLFL